MEKLVDSNVQSFWSINNQAAGDCDLEAVAYEYFTQAFVLYEEEIAVIIHQ